VSKGTKEPEFAPQTKTITVVRKKAKYSKGFDPEIWESMLEALRTGATIRDVRRLHGVSQDWVYNRINHPDYPHFKEQWNAAIEEGNDAIRDEIKRRAMDGVTQDVYHDGKVVGKRKLYSDDLLKFLAKSRMKEFSDRVEVEHTFKLDGAVEALAAKFNQIFGGIIPELAPPVPQQSDRRGSDPAEIPLAVLAAPGADTAGGQGMGDVDHPRRTRIRKD